MPTKSRALTPKPLWIITSYENNRMEALTIGPDHGGGFLALFSFEEEAEAFLCLLEDDEKKKGWHSEQTTAGGLISVLLEPCAHVKGVALDPVPLALSRAMLPLVSMSRDNFLQYLLEECKGVEGELAPRGCYEPAQEWLTNAENGYLRRTELTEKFAPQCGFSAEFVTRSSRRHPTG